jgi:hypothetical protein
VPVDGSTCFVCFLGGLFQRGGGYCSVKAWDRLAECMVYKLALASSLLEHFFLFSLLSNGLCVGELEDISGLLRMSLLAR